MQREQRCVKTRQAIGAVCAVMTALLATACVGVAAPTGASLPRAGLGEEFGTSATAVPAWEAALAGARQEGRLALIGPVGEEFRSVVDTFERLYGISVELHSSPGADIAPRLAAERESGRYLWDVYVGGTTTGLDALVPMGAFDPLDPALLLPENTDRSLWRGGDLEFMDPKRQLLTMTPRQRAIVFFNTNQVQADGFTSYRDLLDPKWKRRIAMDDPRRSGPGQATFTFFFLHPDLGPDFIRALGQQEPQLFRDYRQAADAVGQGRFPLLVGGNDYSVEPLMKLGAPIAILDPRQVREGSDTSPGSGSIALLNRAPHPNAARVFINWLLSRDGQTNFVQALEYISNRLDVPTDHTYSWRVPVPGAVKTYDANAMAAKPALLTLLAEVFGR